MSSRARGVALPFVLQVGASNCCNIADIVVHIRTGVPRIDDGVLLVDGPGTDKEEKARKAEERTKNQQEKKDKQRVSTRKQSKM